MMRFFILMAFAACAHACQCAPLASCVVYPNGTRGCHCPYFGDGVVSCTEQRFVTHATVRVKHDSVLQSWLGHLGRTPTAVSWRKLLSSDSQVVIELDSTDYDNMVQLTDSVNARLWPYEVALLGSATSQIADASTAFTTMESSVALLEVVNVSIVNSAFVVELVATAGLVFLASEVKALPCIHVKGDCCVRDLTFSPYSMGLIDKEKSLASCGWIETDVGKQGMATNSSIERHADNTVTISIGFADINKVAATRMVNGDFESNFSVGLMVGGDLPAATQTYISFRQGRVTANYTVGSFQRQVVDFVLMQLEQVRGQTYARLWARISLANASVVFVQYAWGDMDWIVPRCVNLNDSCYDVPPVCSAQARDSVLELWVPVHDWLDSKGNLSLYAVVRQGDTMARILTQASPAIMTKHCADAVQVNDQVEIQILQGLTLTQIFRGPAQTTLELGTNAQTDVLITLVARSASGLVLRDLLAVHAHTEAQRELILANKTCDDCVVEQLMLNGAVVSPRSCHVIGVGDDLLWIQGYVGLVGSALALDVLGKIPPDVRLDPDHAVAAWVNPAWPWNNESVLSDMTFLLAQFAPQPRTGRRLLMDVVPNGPPIWSKQVRNRPQLTLVAMCLISALIWLVVDFLELLKI
jgi:hypothetical protein